MRYQIMVVFVAAANAIGSTITDMVLMDEKLELARNRPGRNRHRPRNHHVADGSYMSWSDVIQLVKLAEKSAEQAHSVESGRVKTGRMKSGRVESQRVESGRTVRPSRRRSKNNIERLRSSNKFKSHYKHLSSRPSQQDMNTFNKMKRITNRYKNQ